MATQVLPFDSVDPHYSVVVNLEGTRYLFLLDWNDRDGFWYFGISKEDETPILSGLRIVVGCPLIRRYPYAALPPGEIIFTDTSGEDDEAGRNDLGNRVVPYYFPSTDL